MIWVTNYSEGKIVYIIVYRKIRIGIEVDNGKTVVASVLIKGNSSETQILNSFHKRIKKGTVAIILEEDSGEHYIVFKSGPEELKIKLYFDSEKETIEYLLKKNFYMTPMLSDNGHQLSIAFSLLG